MKKEETTSRDEEVIDVYIELWSGTPTTIFSTHPSKVRVTVIEGDLQDFDEKGLLADRDIPQRTTKKGVMEAIEEAAKVDKARKKERTS